MALVWIVSVMHVGVAGHQSVSDLDWQLEVAQNKGTHRDYNDPC